MATTRERLHQLVDALRDDELRVAERYLEYLADVGSAPALQATDGQNTTDEEVPEERLPRASWAYDAPVPEG